MKCSVNKAISYRYSAVITSTTLVPWMKMIYQIVDSLKAITILEKKLKGPLVQVNLKIEATPWNPGSVIRVKDVYKLGQVGWEGLLNPLMHYDCPKSVGPKYERRINCE